MLSGMWHRAQDRESNAEHKVMQEFMRRFSRNMRLAVLTDSKGDMDESRRQALIKKIRQDNYDEDHGVMPTKSVQEER